VRKAVRKAAQKKKGVGIFDGQNGPKYFIDSPTCLCGVGYDLARNDNSKEIENALPGLVL